MLPRKPIPQLILLAVLFLFPQKLTDAQVNNWLMQTLYFKVVPLLPVPSKVFTFSSENTAKVCCVKTACKPYFLYSFTQEGINVSCVARKKKVKTEENIPHP